MDYYSGEFDLLKDSSSSLLSIYFDSLLSARHVEFLEAEESMKEERRIRGL